MRVQVLLFGSLRAIAIEPAKGPFRESKTANSDSRSQPAVPPVLLVAAFTAGIAVAGLIVFFVVRMFVVCFGSSCLQENLVTQNTANAYLFKGEHCFVVAEMLSSRQIADVDYPGLADAALSTAYLVYPDLRLFILPSQAVGGPIISISANLLEPNRDFDFCSENVRMQRGQQVLFR